MSAAAERRATLAEGLGQVRDRIARACAAAGRDPAPVTLIVVTKYFPVDDVLTLHELGVRDFGENRDQEAAVKYTEARKRLGAEADAIRVHFIGQLQTNKASHVSRYADVVHSVDRVKLVAALDRGAHQSGRSLRVLLQVSLDGDTSRGGVVPAEAGALADEVATRALLVLGGVMAVAPREADPAAAFARLREVASGIRDRHPSADWISAGMSADLEAAIDNGATHLRVGTAILGTRPSPL